MALGKAGREYVQTFLSFEGMLAVTDSMYISLLQRQRRN